MRITLGFKYLLVVRKNKMPHYDNIPIWEVDISVIAPIAIRNEFNFNARKELGHPAPFYSEVRIRGHEDGFKATLTAFAPNPQLAEKAAILFFGRMLDVLSLNLNLPLQLDLSRKVLIPNNNENIRRRIDESDFTRAFQESRMLSLTEPTFLRSLSWFRKGKYSQDPFDKFLAYWNSIETVASKYNPSKPECKGKGSICHIWESFKAVWGDCDHWEFINGQTKWIDTCNKHRKNIAHGIIPIEVDFVEKVVDRLDELENVAHKFLNDWRITQLNPVVTSEIEQRIN